MKKYLFKRVIEIIPVLLIISFAVFMLVNVAGDPTTSMLPMDATQEDRDTLREALGLDKPVLEQYGIFIKNAVRGDFGKSFRYNEDALSIVLERLPASVQLAGIVFVMAIVVSVPLGILSAMLKDSPLDIVISGLSVLGRAMPSFWLAIMLVLWFSVENQIFPVSGRGTFRHMVLPSVTLATLSVSQTVPLIRSSMLEIMHEEYVRTARSKGIKEKIVIFKHAFKNALIPVVTIMALDIPSTIGGALITETVFSWPGMGQLMVQAINGKDMSIVQASIMVIAVITMIANLTADIIYCLIDPRIRY